ncbi:MAG: hypothetical protein KatS3mg102_2888 [Planctomycetota bacterium]|nr:MAG: hypothetical protein KatS3mg102_2888 [Planctomycetota bacterium]
MIPVTAAEGRFGKLELRVHGHAIEILDMRVEFGDGESYDVPLRSIFRPGSSSRVIDLPGGARVIRRVEFRYRKVGPRPGPAAVALWGLRVEPEPGPGSGAGAAPAPDDDRGWELLGRREVNWALDRDVIPVTAAEGRFRQIRLHVTGGAVHVLALRVHFGNGEVEDIEVRHRFGPGSTSRVIDLPGEARVIQKIVFIYEKVAGARPATVAVWGRQAAGGPPAAPAPPPAAASDWELLGRREVAWGLDRDVIPVTAAEGRFRKLQLRVHGHPIEVLDLDVEFGNGERQDVAVREVFRPGTSSRVIDLPGDARVIKKVVFWYRKVGPRPGPAVIELWGRH